MKQKKTQQLAYDYIKEKIDSGEWPNQFKLIEQDVATALNTSRTPVRDAISALVEEGYLVKQKNKGVLVERLSISTKEFTDHTYFLEMLLTNYLYQLQIKKSKLDGKELKKYLNKLDGTNVVPDKYLNSEAFLCLFLKELSNDVMAKAIITSFGRIVCIQFPNTSIHFLYREFSRSFSKIIGYIESDHYDLSRKEIRLFFNRLNLELIDQQF